MSFKADGYWSTIKEFHVIPEWELELKHLPLLVLNILPYVNLFMAKFWDGPWAPVGADRCPTVCFFLEVIEEKVDNSTLEAALEVGKVPHIKEGGKI